jgi:hypothetical protein
LPVGNGHAPLGFKVDLTPGVAVKDELADFGLTFAPLATFPGALIATVFCVEDSASTRFGATTLSASPAAPGFDALAAFIVDLSVETFAVADFLMAGFEPFALSAPASLPISLAIVFVFSSFRAVCLTSVTSDTACFLVFTLEVDTFLILDVAACLVVALFFFAGTALIVLETDGLLARGVAADPVDATLFFTLAAMINLFIGKGK